MKKMDRYRLRLKSFEQDHQRTNSECFGYLIVE